MFTLLILQMWSDKIGFDKRPEHSRLDHPLQIVCGHNCSRKEHAKEKEKREKERKKRGRGGDGTLEKNAKN